MPTFRQYLAERTPSRASLERFLDERAHNWARFDAELGYVLSNSVMRDGVDGCSTVTRVGRYGERFSPSMNSGAGDRPCRINSYGDSFTQCHQVSDGETWQEQLGAHLGEPIRNFGTGGHGVYQAWRRLLREEATDHGAEHLIVNLFEDDHRRSVMSWRWLDLWEEAYQARSLTSAEPRDGQAAMFHNNPWSHLAWDLARGDFIEGPSLCPTRAELHRISDPDWLYETFRADPYANLAMAKKGVSGVDLALLKALGEAFAVPLDTSDADALAAGAARLHTEMGLRSTLWILDRLVPWARERGKKLLFVLSYAAPNTIKAMRTGEIEDAPVLERLRSLPEPLVDLREAHRRDYRDFACDHETYAKRYWIGHYSPTGNHFCAFAMKDAVVRWLEPKPVAYRDGGDALARFAGGFNGQAAGAQR